MKRINFVLSSALLLVVCISPGCSKKESQPEPVTEATFKFTANDTTYIWNGNDEVSGYGPRIMKAIYNQNNPDNYGLSAHAKINPYFNYIFLMFTTDTLYEGTNTITNNSPQLFDDNFCQISGSVVYSSFEIGDFAEITVTKIHNGYADGTFLARLTANDSTLSKLYVTDGEFNNVKIEQ